VIEQTGFGFNPTFTCRLGDFIPISREEAEEITALAQEGDRPKRNAITSKPAELPPEAQQKADDEPAAQGDDAAAAQTQPAETAKERRRRERRGGSESSR
jgi:hypothetical protein